MTAPEQPIEESAPQFPDEYCRRVEAYLCRKNEGHLIRIVGPVFEQVSGWATSGIPLKVAFQGIDRYCERYYAKGQRRWPVRIEFCESDVLQAFDDWRRAVGALAGPLAPLSGARSQPETTSEPSSRRRGPSLPAHLERVTIQLSSMLAGTRLPVELRDVIDRTTREVDALRAATRGLRGTARQQIVERLASLEREVLEACSDALPEATRSALRARASSDLASFKNRMVPAAFDAALESAALREVRDHLGLPQIALE